VDDFKFQAHVTRPADNEDDIDRIKTVINLVPLQVPPGEIWKIKDTIYNEVILSANQRLKDMDEEFINDTSEIFRIISRHQENANVYAFQTMFTGSFAIEYSLFSDSSNRLSIDEMNSLFSAGKSSFETEFEKKFRLLHKGFNVKQVEFAQYMLSNMLGGIGYFYGDSIVDSSLLGYDEDQFNDENEEDDDYFQVTSVIKPEPNPQLVEPHELFTGVPSRPFFPRGFLWDSGFDAFLIGTFDQELGIRIISSWAALINEDGWLAREQILGDEARSKVPIEFQTQYTHYANPPIMVATMEKHLSKISLLKENSIEVSNSQNFVNTSYPKFKRQYEWFLKTQYGYIQDWNYGVDIDYGFKWRGRKDSHILTSGKLLY
jgi:mannosyl-oligosaccharide glucosidase